MYDPEYQGSLHGTVAEITRLNANNGRGAAPRDLEHLRARYEGEVTYMDRHIGRLLSALGEKQLLDRTVVAALADHGETSVKTDVISTATIYTNRPFTFHS